MGQIGEKGEWGSRICHCAWSLGQLADYQPLHAFPLVRYLSPGGVYRKCYNV